MTGGTEFSEAEVKPIKEEVDLNPEKGAEIKEAAEVQRETNEATISPEAAVEKGDFQLAEDLQSVFVEAVDAVPMRETPEMDDGKTEDPDQASDEEGKPGVDGDKADSNEEINSNISDDEQDEQSSSSESEKTRDRSNTEEVTHRPTTNGQSSSSESENTRDAKNTEKDTHRPTTDEQSSSSESDNTRDSSNTEEVTHRPTADEQSSSSESENTRDSSNTEKGTHRPEYIGPPKKSDFYTWKQYNDALRLYRAQTETDNTESKTTAALPVALEGALEAGKITIYEAVVAEDANTVSEGRPEAAAIIDSKDAPLSLNTDEIITQLTDRLPEGGDEFSDRTSSEIVERVLAGEENDFVTPVRETIKTEHASLTDSQADELLGLTLLKASQELSSLANKLIEQPPELADRQEVNPSFPNTYPANGESPAGDVPETNGDQPSDSDQENKYYSDNNADDAQLANIDLQNMLQKQQQTIQMLSNISKILNDTALAVIRKIG